MSLESYPDSGPTITVDRAVSHLWETFDVDVEAILEFYEGLEGYADKPVLADCHLHFSSLAVTSGSNSIGGIHIRSGTGPEAYDPNAPGRPNIIIFLGSTKYLNDEPPAQTLDKTLAHELVHLAQSKDESYAKQMHRKEIVNLRVQRKLAQGFGLRGFIAKCLFFTSAVELSDMIDPRSNFDLRTSAMLGVGFTAVSKIITHRKRKRNVMDITDRILALEKLEHYEEEAYHHGDNPPEVIMLGNPNRENYLPFLAFDPGASKLSRRVSKTLHREQALKAAESGVDSPDTPAT